jgi:tripartite-type tricarboxylate transporter receptor subunit TctC
MIGSWDAYNATLYGKVDFNFIRDIAPVASIARGWSIMEVNPSFPAKTLTEFLAYAKANPGKINVGAIAGGSTHLCGELLKMMTGVDMATVYLSWPSTCPD